MQQYFKKTPCPVNIQWHPGTEHYSLGGHDEDGQDPDDYVYQVDDIGARRLAQEARCGSYATTPTKTIPN